MLPGLDALVHYPPGQLRADVVAGATVAAYLIPQVMAYAEVAGLPAITGLWAVLLPLAVYALVGSSRLLSIGPESTTALMTAAGVAALSGGDPARAPEAAAALALAVAAICLIGWIARLGFLANLLSRPVLTGYLAGVALLMIVSQLGKITGVEVSGSTVIAELRSLADQFDRLNPATVILAGSVIIALFVLHRWFPRAPGPLLIMAAATGVVVAAGLEQGGVAVIGSVPRGLPSFALPDMAEFDLAVLIPAALGLAVVAYSDNVLTARAFAEQRHEEIDPRQEFLALGLSNLGSGLTSGFPVSSSGSRTAIADLMGARTQLYSLVTLGLVVLTLVVLAPALGSLPVAALGGLVVYAATRLIDVAEFRRLAGFRRSELLLALATTVAVVFVDVLYGVGIAIGLSIIDLLRRIAAPHDAILGFVPGLAGMHDVDDYPAARPVPGLVIYRYDSPLFFANAEHFKRRALAAVDDADPPARWFVLNAEANVEVDLTALDALEELRGTLAGRGIVFGMARVKHELYETLRAAGFVERVGEQRIFATLPTAVESYRASTGDSAG